MRRKQNSPLPPDFGSHAHRTEAQWAEQPRRRRRLPYSKIIVQLKVKCSKDWTANEWKGNERRMKMEKIKTAVRLCFTQCREKKRLKVENATPMATIKIKMNTAESRAASGAEWLVEGKGKRKKSINFVDLNFFPGATVSLTKKKWGERGEPESDTDTHTHTVGCCRIYHASEARSFFWQPSESAESSITKFKAWLVHNKCDASFCVCMPRALSSLQWSMNKWNHAKLWMIAAIHLPSLSTLATESSTNLQPRARYVRQKRLRRLFFYFHSGSRDANKRKTNFRVLSNSRSLNFFGFCSTKSRSETEWDEKKSKILFCGGLMNCSAWKWKHKCGWGGQQQQKQFKLNWSKWRDENKNFFFFFRSLARSVFFSGKSGKII